MNRMNENHVKGTQCLDLVKEDIVGVNRKCLSKAYVCMLFQQVDSMSMPAFCSSTNGVCHSLALCIKKVPYNNIKDFSVDAQTYCSLFLRKKDRRK